MNKSQLVDAIAKEAAITKVEAKKALDAFIAVTGTALKSGDKIALVGFGSFSVAKKPGRTGRNPRTGAAIKIAPKKVVKFKAGAELSSLVKSRPGRGKERGAPAAASFFICRFRKNG